MGIKRGTQGGWFSGCARWSSDRFSRVGCSESPQNIVANGQDCSSRKAGLIVLAFCSSYSLSASLYLLDVPSRAVLLPFTQTKIYQSLIPIQCIYYKNTNYIHPELRIWEYHWRSKRKQGRSRGSSEEAEGEYKRAAREHGGVVREQIDKTGLSGRAKGARPQLASSYVLHSIRDIYIYIYIYI